MRDVRPAREEVDVRPSICFRLSLVQVRSVVIGRGVLRRMQFREMALEEMLVPKRTFAMLVRSDEVTFSEVTNIVVCREGLLLFERISIICVSAPTTTPHTPI